MKQPLISFFVRAGSLHAAAKGKKGASGGVSGENPDMTCGCNFSILKQDCRNPGFVLGICGLGAVGFVASETVCRWGLW